LGTTPFSRLREKAGPVASAIAWLPSTYPDALRTYRRPATIGAMPSLVILMIVGAIAAALWSSARAAAERAEVVGRNACRAANVQLLDQTVHATGVRLHRGADGRLGFERAFRFEYSEGGDDRNVGRLVLRGDELVYFSGPAQAASVVQLH
jgi:hypothetical protein